MSEHPNPNTLLRHMWSDTEHSSASVSEHLEQCSMCRGIVQVAMRSVPSRGSEQSTARPGRLVSPWLGSSERYTLVEECGRGAQSHVFAAYDRQLGRVVALKEFSVGVRGSDASSRGVSRFVREASIASSLEHPNIAPVHELGVGDDGAPFYTMRMVRGQTLGDAVRDCSSLAERLKLIENLVQVGEAIVYAHGEGVIHRDLKPANVMIAAGVGKRRFCWIGASRSGWTRTTQTRSRSGPRVMCLQPSMGRWWGRRRS